MLHSHSGAVTARLPGWLFAFSVLLVSLAAISLTLNAESPREAGYFIGLRWRSYRRFEVYAFGGFGCVCRI
jgi:hypothetical protein